MGRPDTAPPAPRPQLLVDLSVLLHQDDQSGIQRVVRHTLAALRRAAPPRWQLRPVHAAGGHYAYAETDQAGRYRPGSVAIAVAPGDLFLGLDLCPDQVPAHAAVLADLRRHGVRICFVVYDLLPLTLPSMFAAGAAPWFERWLRTVAGGADALLCISRAVADQLLDWLEQARVANPGTLMVDYFHLGADLEEPSRAARAPLPDPAGPALPPGLPAFLMVGTLEPRKMHGQALDAFELLWRDGVAACLVIVGKPGWMTEQLQARLAGHPELGQRLFWLAQASDAELQQLYRRCSALLAASAGEGFGLPLIEAARHGLPLVVRDLPVFREVCGEHAHYFSGASPQLAAALRHWLALRAAGQAPDARGLPWLSWQESGARLLDLLETGPGYRQAPTLLA